ncbi:hypothetical protein PLESTB_000797800 [Pleodorina starrii]|uniref:adenylate kinase n=1 Tax=Pleodorina starrii TaxID=330485 RepID=A0A9W6F2E1_9CHLO|nr:hypothetical protein PLESTM_000631600 [Pleodorina starrii]GLC53862.1 hypothetical protein PLESTB_000797800 [Pleodorina starrii]GLC75449.1 hypothetical protein PLESTF_001638000 [Pleodorina starrii]
MVRLPDLGSCRYIVRAGQEPEIGSARAISVGGVGSTICRGSTFRCKGFYAECRAVQLFIHILLNLIDCLERSLRKTNTGLIKMLAQQRVVTPRQSAVFRSGKAFVRPARRTIKTNATLKVMIAGAPAAGKGTQCAKIIEKYNLVHISVGDILRDEVKNGTAAGKKAKDFMDRGVLVPDEVVVEMVKSRLAQEDVKQRGWLLDGYPRSASQAEAIEKEAIRPDLFLLIQVPDELLVERVVGRRLDPVTGAIYHLKYNPPPPEIVSRLQQRSDDTEEKCRVRVDTHNANVGAVVGYYKDVMVEIDGTQSMDDVFAAISKALDQAIAKSDPLEAYCQTVPEADECRVYE